MLVVRLLFFIIWFPFARHFGTPRFKSGALWRGCIVKHIRGRKFFALMMFCSNRNFWGNCCSLLWFRNNGWIFTLMISLCGRGNYNRIFFTWLSRLLLDLANSLISTNYFYYSCMNNKNNDFPGKFFFWVFKIYTHSIRWNLKFLDCCRVLFKFSRSWNL